MACFLALANAATSTAVHTQYTRNAVINIWLRLLEQKPVKPTDIRQIIVHTKRAVQGILPAPPPNRMHPDKATVLPSIYYVRGGEHAKEASSVQTLRQSLLVCLACIILLFLGGHMFMYRVLGCNLYKMIVSASGKRIVYAYLECTYDIVTIYL